MYFYNIPSHLFNLDNEYMSSEVYVNNHKVSYLSPISIEEFYREGSIYHYPVYNIKCVKTFTNRNSLIEKLVNEFDNLINTDSNVNVIIRLIEETRDIYLNSLSSH